MIGSSSEVQLTSSAALRHLHLTFVYNDLIARNKAHDRQSNTEIQVRGATGAASVPARSFASTNSRACSLRQRRWTWGRER